MYDLMPLFFCGIMFILGLVMVINPKGSTKKELHRMMLAQLLKLRKMVL